MKHNKLLNEMIHLLSRRSKEDPAFSEGIPVCEDDRRGGRVRGTYAVHFRDGGDRARYRN